MGKRGPKPKEFCIRGHKFEEGSFRWDPNGGRQCKQCSTERLKERMSDPEYAAVVKAKRAVKYLENVDEKREKFNEYNKSLKGKYTSLKGDSKRLNRIMEISFEKFCELNSNPCHYCGGKLGESGYSLDRVDSGLGYLLNNVVPCCKLCNMTKSNKLTYLEMMNLMAFRRITNPATACC